MSDFDGTRWRPGLEVVTALTLLGFLVVIGLALWIWGVGLPVTSFEPTLPRAVALTLGGEDGSPLLLEADVSVAIDSAGLGVRVLPLELAAGDSLLEDVTIWAFGAALVERGGDSLVTVASDRQRMLGAVLPVGARQYGPQFYGEYHFPGISMSDMQGREVAFFFDLVAVPHWFDARDETEPPGLYRVYSRPTTDLARRLGERRPWER